MSDFINSIVSIVLAFVLLVLSPMVVTYKADEMIAKREILSDVTMFIDKAKDTGSITEEDLNKLYVTCNSRGLAVDVAVKRLIRTDVTKESETKIGEFEITTVYYAVDDINGLSSMNTGDVVKVIVTELGISTTRRLIYNTLKIDNGKFEFSLAGKVG